jgi:hypothetical protein
MWTHLIRSQYTFGFKTSCESLAFLRDRKELSIEGNLIGPIALITSAGDAVTNLKDQTDFKSRLLEIIAGLKNQVSSHINVNDFGTFHQAVLREYLWTPPSTWYSMKKEYAVWSG